MISQGVSRMPSCTSVAVIIWALFTISSWPRVYSALSASQYVSFYSDRLVSRYLQQQTNIPIQDCRSDLSIEEVVGGTWRVSA